MTRDRTFSFAELTWSIACCAAAASGTCAVDGDKCDAKVPLVGNVSSDDNLVTAGVNVDNGNAKPVSVGIGCAAVENDAAVDDSLPEHESTGSRGLRYRVIDSDTIEVLTGITSASAVEAALENDLSDSHHDTPREHDLDEARISRIAAAAAAEVAAIAQRTACMCCQRLARDDNSTTVDLSDEAPSSWTKKLALPEETTLPMALRQFYTIQGANVHSSWTTLLLCKESMFTAADGMQAASICKSCKAILSRKSGGPPKASVANGNWWGSAAAIPELADLTPAEWSFLGKGRCDLRAVHHITVTALQGQTTFGRTQPDGSIVHPTRAKLTGHVVVRRATPSETLRRLDGRPESTLKVHLCVGNLKTDAEVRAAIAETTRTVVIDVERVTTAHAWLVANNANYADDEFVPPDVNADGTIRGVLTVTGRGGASTSGDTTTDVVEVAPNSNMESVADATSLSTSGSIDGRSSFIGVDYSDDGAVEAVDSAVGYVPMWNAENVPVAHPQLFPWGVAGPAQTRTVQLGPIEHTRLTMQCHLRQFAQNEMYVLERNDAYTRKAATSALFASVYRSPGAVTDNPFLVVSKDDLQAAAKHYDDKLNAVRSGKPMPAAPASLSAAAIRVMQTVKRAKKKVPGTVEAALADRNKLHAINRCEIDQFACCCP